MKSTDGLGVQDAMRLVHAELGWPMNAVSASAAWVENRVAELLAVDARWRPGAAELLAELRFAGVPTALVTATRRAVVSRIPGLEGFSAVICGDDVTRAKPHPEPYLAALRRLGAVPRLCVAVEDTAIGAASAAAAGCVVLLTDEDPAVESVRDYAWTATLADIGLDDLRRLLTRKT